MNETTKRNLAALWREGQAGGLETYPLRYMADGIAWAISSGRLSSGADKALAALSLGQLRDLARELHGEGFTQNDLPRALNRRFAKED